MNKHILNFSKVSPYKDIKIWRFLKMTSLLLFFCTATVWAGADAEVEIITVNSKQWPAQYEIKLTPPLHYHAYLDSGDENAYLPVAIDPKKKLAQQGIVVSTFSVPRGEYDANVKASVLRKTGTFKLSLLPKEDYTLLPKTADIALRYQLCDEVTNVCFRPKTVMLTLKLPSEVPVQSNDFLEKNMAEKTWMEQLLGLFTANKNNSVLLFLLMFLAGVLSVATPCVYPMLPITSMLIVNRAQGQDEKIKFHASIYLFGMISTYVLLGIAAGMTGGAFNVFMQSAAVNLAFSLFFAFFALSLLGYYEFGFMQSEVGALDQKTSKIKGLTGTLLMGSVAGLVISPCVGPIVFALLLQVADNIAEKADALAALGQVLSTWDRFTISVNGGLMMGGFGLGVGLPFFIISVVKIKLPRAGYWMNKVKYGFGFAILYFAYTYFTKGLSVLQVPNDAITVLAVSLIAIWVAIVHCDIFTAIHHDSEQSKKLSRFVGVVAFIIGGWLLVSGLNHMPIMNSVYAAQQIQATTTQSDNDEGGIHWYRSIEAAKQAAQASGKPIFIDFYASWCANCLEFAAETVNNNDLNYALRELAIPLKLVDKEPEFEAFKQKPEHRNLKIGLPYFTILDAEGNAKWSGTDYKAVKTMVSVFYLLKG